MSFLEKNKINTSSLVSAVTLNTRRARVDEQNLNYSESDDETSEGLNHILALELNVLLFGFLC